MPHTADSRLLSLGRACQVLGVNATTLRQWANTGLIRAFRTPGGHRRFSKEDLNGLIQVAPTKSNGATGDTRLGAATLERIRRRIGRQKTRDEHWLTFFDDEGRARMRILGRRLVSLTTEYTSRRRRRTELQEEARHLGVDYGRELATRNVGLADAISAFIFFRNFLHGGVDHAGTAYGKVSGLRSMVELEDLVLLGMASVYEAGVRLQAVTLAPSRLN